MLLDPHQLQHNLDRVEEIERASLRHVVQALYDYRQTAKEVFHAEIDLVADVGEDITRAHCIRHDLAGWSECAYAWRGVPRAARSAASQSKGELARSANSNHHR